MSSRSRVGIPSTIPANRILKILRSQVVALEAATNKELKQSGHAVYAHTQQMGRWAAYNTVLLMIDRMAEEHGLDLDA